MTEGYLWTGQYEEAKRIYESEDGQPHSMKLHEETLQGHWSKSVKQGMDFFIINDAIIQNLCILGEDTEPCFEGADVTAPKISAHFSKDNNFVTTLFTMMKQLDETLKNEKGGNSMAIEQIETPVVEENFSTNQDKVDESVKTENQVITEEFAKVSDDKKDEEDKKEDEESKKKYSLLEQELSELKSNYAALEESYKELVAFKNAIDDEKKDALISQFYMLSDEDKKDVIDNKSKYTLDDIEAKLSVICVRKKVNFDLESKETKVEEAAPVTYNLNAVEADNLPAWLKAVEATKNRNL